MLAGISRELNVLAAEGLLPLSSDELLTLQIHLVGHGEPLIAELAAKSIAGADPRLLARFASVEAGESELRFLAHQTLHPSVLEAVLRRREVPRDLLVELAATIPPSLQEVLILRQDAIVEEPAILDALESNLALESDVRRRIGEYRQHLVARTPAVEALRSEFDLTVEEAREIERVRELPKEGEVDATTGLSEGQIRALPVPVRVKLARGATKTLRGILIRDLNQVVALAVLERSSLTDDELEQVANSRSVIEDVLVAIARHRDWVSRYRVALALARNPKTPVAVAVRMVGRLGVRDLKFLATDRNVSDAVRATAGRLYKMKLR